MVLMASAAPHTGPQDFNEGPQAAANFKALTQRILTTPKAALVKDAPKKPAKKK
jgi:hypothetical protein